MTVYRNRATGILPGLLRSERGYPPKASGTLYSGVAGVASVAIDLMGTGDGLWLLHIQITAAGPVVFVWDDNNGMAAPTSTNIDWNMPTRTWDSFLIDSDRRYMRAISGSAGWAFIYHAERIAD